MTESTDFNRTDHTGYYTGLLVEILQLQQGNGDQGLDFGNFAFAINFTKEPDPDLLRRYQTNSYFTKPLMYLFIFAYGLFFSFGTLGNCLAVCAVIRKPTMRTPRNMFIINLAVSDLLLCVITMPLTLMEILTTYWPFGNDFEFLCKTFGCLQAISIFVSTISITAISIDRYHVIVYPTKASVQMVGALLALAGIWTVACLLAAPLFVVRRLDSAAVPSGIPDLQRDTISFCVEEWPITNGRAYYSICAIIIQYALPIIVVSIAYFRICKKLRYRMKPGGRIAENPSGGGGGGEGTGRTGSVRKDQARMRRTNMLLISIAVIFGISWMPLNVFNLICDVFQPPQIVDNWYIQRIIYAFCHLIGMSSANTNPLLYGFFNDNFRKEFNDIWKSFKRFCCCKCRSPEDDFVGSRSTRESRADREPTVNYKQSKPSPIDVEEEGADIEQSTLITQVLDRQK